MEEFTFTVEITVEGSDKDDAFSNLEDILSGDPSIVEFDINSEIATSV